MEKNMLTVKNITKSLGRNIILKNVNFCLKKGQIVALVGPNGAGKTTLMRCIAGFYDVDRGEISFDGKLLSDKKCRVLQDFAYVPEVGGLYPEMTVFEYLSFLYNFKKPQGEDFRKKATKIIADFDLSDFINKKCKTLSKGVRRRVAVAGALIAAPEVLILDEPSEGLDPIQKQKLREIIQKYAKGAIILISTHIMEDVEAIADRILLMKNGKLICDSKLEELKKATEQNSVEKSFHVIVGD